ncbi:MAG: DUF4445 domain-containing protein [Candidatus Omnitrophica bacterium]|nr:DUF4445 domain-containing protein [Candidatus Omnitrophota bacterium]
MSEFVVTFEPHNKHVIVPRGTDLLTACLRAGIFLSASCGGEGLCGKCKVVVRKGAVKSERSRLVSEEERKKGVVLACESIVESDLEVFIPQESIETHPHLTAESEECAPDMLPEEDLPFKHAPMVEKIYLELDRPTHEDSISDLGRIYKALEDRFKTMSVSTHLANVKHLGDVLRESDFKVTATVGYKDGAFEILALEPGDTTRLNYGFAFDIGTTTVTGELIDLHSKKVLATRIAYNRQAGYGSDIITRIIYGSTPEGLEKLSEAIVSNIDEMVEDMAEACEINLATVGAVLCAGNVTMMHLLLKIDPTHIRKEPYVATVTAFPTTPISEVGIELNPKGLFFSVPGVATYVGGDIVAGVLSSGLYKEEDLALLIDIGTNGEIVLGNKEWMIGAAASAGPAFEGSGLAFGMKAVKGAIQKVSIDEKLGVACETIGSDKPRGICGSGYIDLLFQMAKRKIIARNGKIDRGLASKRIRKNEYGYEFVVAFKDESAVGKDIVITEDDIENLKRAKGAIYSAIISLLDKVGKKAEDLKRIYIAGGFGSYINVESAVSIGLLPDIDRKLYAYIGNSSLAGARLSLLSREAFLKTHEIHKGITYLDLSSEPRYMDEYIASLFFPHTDMGRFPSVRL